MTEVIEALEKDIKIVEGIVQSPAQKQQSFRTLAAACDFISGFQVYPVNINYVNSVFVVTYNNSEI